MKKFFLSLSLMASVVMGVHAESGDGYRRTWDFTKGWSAATVDKLTADATNWEPQATGFQNNPTAMTANETPWVMVDGEKEPIAELVGMTINSSLAKAKHCQICTTGSGLADVPCFWLNGKGDAVSVKVPAGENVRFGYTAHGTSDRGFKCGGGFADANGVTQFTSTDNQQIHEVELINSNAEESTLTLTTVNGGCHIYYIIIGNGDPEEEPVDVRYNVAYLYDASYNGAKDAAKNPIGYAQNGGLESDPIYATLNDNFNVTAIDFNADEIKALTSALFNDSMMTFDVVVLSEAVSSGNTYAVGMKDIINKVPMVNFKSFMYKSGVWSLGAGVNPNPKATAVLVGEDYMDHPLFNEVTINEDGTINLFNTDEVAGGNLVQGYTANEGSLFAEDDVLATAGGSNAIHTHGGTRNQYILLPFSSDNLVVNGDWNVTDNALSLAVNAVKMVGPTKTQVKAVTTPTITQTYGDGVTTITLACGNKAAQIYYTLDGTDPTSASTLYTEPFEVTADGVEVKVLAVAQGYDNSEIVSATVIIKTQTVAPQIAVNGNIVTITCTEEGAIYYSYSGIADEKLCSAYEGEITVPENTKIYAFAVASNKLPSELVSARVYVSPTQQDTLSVFDPNETDWFKNVVLLDYKKDTLDLPTSNWSNSAAYYFGKNSWKYYSDEVDHTEVVYEADGVTPVKSLVDPAADSLKTIYKVNPESVKYAHSTTAPAWYLFSQGQPFTGETTLAPENGVGNGAASRYAEKAEDLIGGAPTKGALTFGGKADGDPYTASVVTSQKYVGPFDIVTYIGNGNGSGVPVLVAEVSADGENWTRLDTIPLSSTQRYFKKNRISYTENAEVYVRIANIGGASKAQIYNIYLLSGNMEVNPEAGIEDIAVEVAKTSVAFDLQGRQVSKLVPGQLYIQNGKKVVVR
ncbi:MAG: chitobiase/beta-hexosaminidase C-terminal domain-containing protein [Bacteroidales bacterium]|nr:chitobiase/beta-hexosaminidase C-terminal domain-containing protein [Bacteroidales bacterium]